MDNLSCGMAGTGIGAHDITSMIYSCFGLCLDSSLPLPELPEGAPGDPRAIPDIITVRLGALPEHLKTAASEGPSLAVVGEDVVLTVKGIARYAVLGGREILIDPFPDAGEKEIRLFLLGSAIGALCHRRGLTPLHANAIVTGSGAVAFAGRSGAGKSTLAAHFQGEGYEVLSDDVCVVSLDEAGQPLAWPGIPRVKLWGEAARAFGHEPADLEQAFSGLDKYHVPLPARGERRAWPLLRFYVLEDAKAVGTNEITRLKHGEALALLMRQVYRGAYLDPMGVKPQAFRTLAALASRIEVYCAPREMGYDIFRGEAERLERHFLEA